MSKEKGKQELVTKNHSYSTVRKYFVFYSNNEEKQVIKPLLKTSNTLTKNNFDWLVGMYRIM